MNDERKRILEMVSDGTITPSEGARLLDALGSSGRGRDRGGKPGRKTLVEASAMLSEIGPMIQETMGDIFRGSRKQDPLGSLDFQEYDSYQGELPEGRDIVIHGTMNRGKSISISLGRSEDSQLRASVDGGEQPVNLCENKGRTMVMWKEGNLSVQVPDTAGSVTVVSRGGTIEATGLRVPSTLNTMGGSIGIYKPGASFSAKTMGGSLDITIDGAWSAGSKAKSMGGGVSVTVEEGLSVLIDASTLGGTIDPGQLDHEVVSTSGGKRGGAKMCLRYGTEADPPKLAVSTMGGDIAVKGQSE